MRERIAQSCEGCGTPVRNKFGICRSCRDQTPSPFALPEGRWVPNGRGIMVFRLSGDGSPPRRKPMFCGTERGYQWHRTNDPLNWPLPADDPCGCRAAHRAHWHFTQAMKKREKRAREKAA